MTGRGMLNLKRTVDPSTLFSFRVSGFWFQGFRVSGFHPNRGRGRDRDRYRNRLFHHRTHGMASLGFFWNARGKFLIFMKFHVFHGFIQIGIGIAIAFGIDCLTTGHFLWFQGFKVSGFLVSGLHPHALASGTRIHYGWAFFRVCDVVQHTPCGTERVKRWGSDEAMGLAGRVGNRVRAGGGGRGSGVAGHPAGARLPGGQSDFLRRAGRSLQRLVGTVYAVCPGD